MPKKAKKPEKSKKAKGFDPDEIPVDWLTQINLAEARSMAALFLTKEILRGLVTKKLLGASDVREVIDQALLSLETVHAGSGPDASAVAHARVLMEAVYAAFAPQS